MRAEATKLHTNIHEAFYIKFYCFSCKEKIVFIEFVSLLTPSSQTWESETLVENTELIVF